MMKRANLKAGHIPFVVTKWIFRILVKHLLLRFNLNMYFFLWNSANSKTKITVTDFKS